MEVYLAGSIFMLGLVFGSFYNVVGLRVPRKILFKYDRSYCLRCGETLTWKELIPVLSFLIQAGRCRHCEAKISPLYPAIECMTGCLFLFSYLQLGLTLEFVIALLFMSMLMIIFVADITYMLIPNRILLFFTPFFIIMRTIVPLDPWYSSILGSLVGFGLIALIIALSRGGMGAGDMKLFGVLGIVLGLGNILLTFFIATLFGSIIGGIRVIAKKGKRSQAMPFGPYIAIGAIISYFYGPVIIEAYISLI